MVSVSASINLPLHRTVQKFSSGAGSPGWSWKKGRKTVVVCVVVGCKVLRWPCLCVCLLAYLKNDMSKRHKIIYISIYIFFFLLRMTMAWSHKVPCVSHWLFNYVCYYVVSELQVRSRHVCQTAANCTAWCCVNDGSLSLHASPLSCCQTAVTALYLSSVFIMIISTERAAAVIIVLCNLLCAE